MKIIIERPPYSISEQGGRKKNEDDLFPAKWEVSPLKSLFLVCDGVGGNAYGEYASRTACEAIPEYFLDNNTDIVTEDYVKQAIAYARSRFRSFVAKHFEAEGMSTTLTLLSLNKLGATAAWIGDSRIYHIRNGSVAWKSRDHSFVNELVAAGAITEEDAIDHPKRNIITRSLNASSDDQAAVKILDDIRQGDYFFMCTDGVLENISDADLAKILEDRSSTTKQKRDVILNRCLGRTRDNFTCYLIRVERVDSENEETTYRAYGAESALDDEIPTARIVDTEAEAESEQAAANDAETRRVDDISESNTDSPRTGIAVPVDSEEDDKPKKKTGLPDFSRRGNDKPNYLGWLLSFILVGLIVFSYFYFIYERGIPGSEETEMPVMKAVSDTIDGFVLREVNLEWEIAGDDHKLLGQLVNNQLILRIFSDAGGLIKDHTLSFDGIVGSGRDTETTYLKHLFVLPDTGIYKAFAYVKNDTSAADLFVKSDTIVIFSEIPDLQHDPEVYTRYHISRHNSLPVNIAKKNILQPVNHHLIPGKTAGLYLFLSLKQDTIPAIYNHGLVSDTNFKEKFYLAVLASLQAGTFPGDKIHNDTTIADYWKLDFEYDSLFIAGIAQPIE